MPITLARLQQIINELKKAIQENQLFKNRIDDAIKKNFEAVLHQSKRALIPATDVMSLLPATIQDIQFKVSPWFNLSEDTALSYLLNSYEYSRLNFLSEALYYYICLAGEENIALITELENAEFKEVIINPSFIGEYACIPRPLSTFLQRRVISYTHKTDANGLEIMLGQARSMSSDTRPTLGSSPAPSPSCVKLPSIGDIPFRPISYYSL